MKESVLLTKHLDALAQSMTPKEYEQFLTEVQQSVTTRLETLTEIDAE